MSSEEKMTEGKKSAFTSKDKKTNPTPEKKNFHESAKSFRKKSSSPKEKQNQVPIIPERDLQIDFSLSFKEIYNIHITEIENKTKLKRKYIYYFLLISLFFFLIGHFEIIFSYIITGYFPVKWTIEDYKEKKENCSKKWGTYWTLFISFMFLDFHKKEVLKYIPLYFIVKTIFLMILFLPGFTAAVNLYDGLIKDFLQKLSIYFQNKEENETMVNDLKKYVKLKTE